MAVEIGPESILDAARRLGVTIRPPFAEPLPSVALGSGTITTFDAAAMFATLSRGGVRTTPHLIKSIIDGDGNAVYQSSPSNEQGVAADVVEEVNLALSEVPRRGTAASAINDYPELAFNSIGKTASTPDYEAAWYVGSTNRYTIAVSVTRADQMPLQDVMFNRQLYARVFGSSVPAPIWAEIASRLP